MKLVICSGQLIFGSATKVPEPCRRTSRPSPTSSLNACRTVVREVSSSAVSSRSVGTGLPGGRLAISSSRCRLTT